MAGTGIMAGICTSPYPSPYPTEKVGDSPYPYSYPVNAGILHQNGDGFGQYPRGRVYLPSLVSMVIKWFVGTAEEEDKRGGSVSAFNDRYVFLPSTQ